MRKDQSQQSASPTGKKISTDELSGLPNGSVVHVYFRGKLDRIAVLVKDPIRSRTLTIYLGNKNRPGTWQKKPISSQHFGQFVVGGYGDYYLQDEVDLGAPGAALAERMALAARKHGLTEAQLGNFVVTRFNDLAERYPDKHGHVSDAAIAAYLKSFISVNRIDTQQANPRNTAKNSVQNEKIAELIRPTDGSKPMSYLAAIRASDEWLGTTEGQAAVAAARAALVGDAPQLSAELAASDAHSGFAVGDRVKSTNKNTGLGLTGEIKEIGRTPDRAFRHFVVAWDGGGRGLLGPDQIIKEVPPRDAVQDCLEDVQTFAFIGDRPENVPKNWLVFNAPRPLFGHIEWQGDFRHGRFYVAIDRAGERADALIRRTHELDGWLVRYFAEGEVRGLAFQWAEKEYPQYVQGGELVDDSVSEEDIIETFKNHFEGRKKYGELPESEKRWAGSDPDLEAFLETSVGPAR